MLPHLTCPQNTTIPFREHVTLNGRTCFSVLRSLFIAICRNDLSGRSFFFNRECQRWAQCLGQGQNTLLRRSSAHYFYSWQPELGGFVSEATRLKSIRVPAAFRGVWSGRPTISPLFPCHLWFLMGNFNKASFSSLSLHSYFSGFIIAFESPSGWDIFVNVICLCVSGIAAFEVSIRTLLTNTRKPVWNTHLTNYIGCSKFSRFSEVLWILHSIVFPKQHVTSTDSWSPFFSHLYDGLGFPLALQSQNKVSSTAASVSLIIWIQWGFAADEIHINNQDLNNLLIHTRIKGLICTALIRQVCTNRGSPWFCFESPNETN